MKPYSEKFGTKRLVFLKSLFSGDIPHIKEEELSSIKNQNETKEPGLDTEKLSRELNKEISKYYITLAMLPPEFNRKMKKEMLRFIRNSTDRFDKNEKEGLSKEEFEAFSLSMKKRVKRILDTYAPTKESIEKKQAVDKKSKEAIEASKKISEVELNEVEADPGEIEDLFQLNDCYGNFDTWNRAIQDKTQTSIKKQSAFLEKYGSFQSGKNGLQSYNKFLNYFNISDSNDYNELEKAREKAAKTTKENIGRLKKAQENAEKYGNKVAKASNKLKKEKVRERDAHLKRIESEEAMSDEQKLEKSKVFSRLEAQHNALESQKEDLTLYKETVLSTQKEKVDDRMEFAELRKGQLKDYDSRLSDGLEVAKNRLESGDLSEAEAGLLRQLIDHLEKRSHEAYLGQLGADAVLDEGNAQWEKLNNEEKNIAQKHYGLETQLELIDQDTGLIESQLSILSEGMLQFTDSKEVVNNHYENVFKKYDDIDAAVDEAVLTHNLATERVISQLESQQTYIEKLSLNPPSGIKGLYESTAGVAFGTIGGGLMYAGEWAVNGVSEMDRELRLAREDGMKPAEYWAKKIGLEVAGSAIGVAGGLAEMGGGISMMAAQPGEAIAGLGNMIGRNSQTGEWSTDTLKQAWTNMGKGMISWEDFEAGRVGVGLGKIFPNVVFALSGGGVAAQSARAGKAALTAARTAGKSARHSLGAGLKTGLSTGVKLTGKETLRIAKSPITLAKDVVEAGKFIKNAKWSDVVDLAKNAKSDVAARNKLTQKLFGKEAVERGLSRKEVKAMEEIQENSHKINEYNELKNRLRDEHPSLSDAEIDYRISQENPLLFAENRAIEAQIQRLIQLKERYTGNYHLETDGLSGMKQKQALYTLEGMDELKAKFGPDVELTFADVTGMGIGNKYLGKEAATARNNVDASFKLMKEVADNVFKDKPFEIIRFGGDEIVFLTKKADQALMKRFFKEFNEVKRRYLTDKIGEGTYEKAKLETNIKAQQKLITKDPGYQEAFKHGPEALNEWFKTELSKTGGFRSDPKETSEMFRELAEKRLPKKEAWLEPLDFYRTDQKRINLSKGNEEIRKDLMENIAKADSDIAWQKAHPGKAIPKNREYGKDVVEAADNYLKEAKDVTQFGDKLKGLKNELAIAKETRDFARVAELERQIITVKTRDPGTGTTRLDKARDYQVDEIMPISENNTQLHLLRMDVPYFGVYNNHHGYVAADQMMKSLASTLSDHFNGKVNLVRDGGNLIAISKKPIDPSKLSQLNDKLNEIIEPLANPGGDSIDRRSAMRREVGVKQATTGSKEEFGKVKLHSPHTSKVEKGQKLWDLVNPIL